MRCPYCRNCDSRVLDSREADDGASVRRRRQCGHCERRFTTLEQMQLVVKKASGVLEPFNRDKIVNGVRKSFAGRPIADEELAKLAQRVEEELRATGQGEVTSEEVGVAILNPLQELDLVAYLRFASVYRHFNTLSDFTSEIQRLQEITPDNS